MCLIQTWICLFNNNENVVVNSATEFFNCSKTWWNYNKSQNSLHPHLNRNEFEVSEFAWVAENIYGASDRIVMLSYIFFDVMAFYGEQRYSVENVLTILVLQLWTNSVSSCQTTCIFVEKSGLCFWVPAL